MRNPLLLLLASSLPTSVVPAFVTTSPSSLVVALPGGFGRGQQRKTTFQPHPFLKSPNTSLWKNRNAAGGADQEETTDGPSGSTTSAIKLQTSSAASSRRPTSRSSVLCSPRPDRNFQIKTLLRIILPSIAIGVIAFATFPYLSLFLVSRLQDGALTVLSQDSSQFVQNFLNVSSVLFSILVGQTYGFMYQQQESVYYALFNEVTEAKSLLEQVALVCQGRSMYKRCLECIHVYVQEDLKKLNADPAVLLSARPVDDPLEGLMYMTSVGVPSTVYETVRSLRQARAGRLGALQRKLPLIHILLLWILAAIELVSFPLLGAGTQTLGGYNLLTVEGILFGVMTCGIVLTLRVVGELWRVTGGAYNVDAVLSVMVSGLEEELAARVSGNKIYTSAFKSPSAPNDPMDNDNDDVSTPPTITSASALPDSSSTTLPILQQGPNIGVAGLAVFNWIRRRVVRR